MRRIARPALVLSLLASAPAMAQVHAPPSVTLQHGHDTGPVENTTRAEQVVITFTVSAPGAEWMRLYFDEVQLSGDVLAGTGSILRVTSWLDGHFQQLNAIHVEQWQRSTAYFNGDTLQVEVIAQPGTGPSRIVTRALDVGVTVGQLDSQCGPTDDRELSGDPRSARLLPVGCTGWLIDDCAKCFLTAGHCSGSASVVQFNVPPSTSLGGLVNPPPSDQYTVDSGSMQTNGGQGVGDDWAYFGVFPNSTTGLTPFQAQGSAFTLVNPPPAGGGNQIRITGYGTDSSPPERNQVQQTHVGPLVTSSGTTVQYQTDTTGGNSGSPVIWEQTGQAVGIHTHGGCQTSGSGANSGTGIQHAALQNALANPQGVCAAGISSSSYPSAMSPGVPAPVSLQVAGSPTPGSVQLHYRYQGGAFASAPMTDAGGGLFTGQLPAAQCGDSPEFYFSVDDASCGLLTDPPGAPSSFFMAIVGTTLLTDDLESASGWTVGFPGDAATTGIWERVDPVATAAQPGDDHTPAPGVSCFVTGQHPGGGIGANDVDGGRTTLLTPLIDLSGATDPRVSYWRWYSNDQGTNRDDVFEVLATDDGSSWVQVELLGPTGPGTTGGWIRHEVRVLDLPGVQLTGQFQLRFVASDLGAGSIVEAAIDDLEVFDVGCGAAAPVAEFSGSPTSGVAPLLVAFSDLSTGSVTGWSWSFGDGGTSTQENPSHTYVAAGSYTVSLTVSGPGGSNTETKTAYVAVGEPAPVAEFSGSPLSGTAPLAVAFSDLSSGSVSSWSWSFGDGGTSTAQNPGHTYSANGSYTVALTVTGPGGSDTETKTAYIVVSEPTPVAEFSGSPTSGLAPLAVSFADLSSGAVTSWSWDFGDGATSSAQNPSHTYTLSGSYTVELTVTGPGGSDTETKTGYVNVAAPAPTADFSASPTAGTAPLAVAFSDLSSGEISSWSWDFGDGGTSSAQEPSHTYTQSGLYTVSLTVTGPGGSDTRTRVDYVSVAAAPPVADFDGSPTTGQAPLQVFFADQSSGEITSRSWDFGDGGTSTLTNPAHVYATSGSYTVSLTVSGPGGSDTRTRTDYIVVTAAPPTASFAASPTGGQAPLPVSFADASTGEITSWSWDFGDGGTSTDPSPSHEYATSGSYTVSLTVTGPGGSDMLVRPDYVVVTAAPPVAEFTGTPLMGTAPMTVAFTDLSAGETASWSWDFGDGGTSTMQNEVYTYTEAGVYTVSLTVTGPGGSDTETKVDYVVVDRPVIGSAYCTPAVANSTGQPASIQATGSTSLAANDVMLHASSMPLDQFGYFLASPTQGFIPNPGGSAGNFCLGSGPLLGRYDGNVQSSGAAGAFALAIDVTAVPIAAAPGTIAIQPGETWNFQCWHRDGATSNFTDGVSIDFE